MERRDLATIISNSTQPPFHDNTFLVTSKLRYIVSNPTCPWDYCPLIFFWFCQWQMNIWRQAVWSKFRRRHRRSEDACFKQGSKPTSQRAVAWTWDGSDGLQSSESVFKSVFNGGGTDPFKRTTSLYVSDHIPFGLRFHYKMYTLPQKRISITVRPNLLAALNWSRSGAGGSKEQGRGRLVSMGCIWRGWLMLPQPSRPTKFSALLSHSSLKRWLLELLLTAFQGG